MDVYRKPSTLPSSKCSWKSLDLHHLAALFLLISGVSATLLSVSSSTSARIKVRDDAIYFKHQAEDRCALVMVEGIDVPEILVLRQHVQSHWIR